MKDYAGEICMLCRANPSIKTGSHIFSWFLIKGAINKMGTKRRDNEISFEISNETFVKTFLGKEILPEEIAKIKGRQLTDEEIAEMTNPFTKDYILCPGCEKRIGKLEDIISNKIFSFLRNYNVKSEKYDVVKVDEGGLMRLFVYSLAWRATIVTQNDFRMNKSHEERLRKMLDENLSVDEDELIENVESNQDEINELPLIVTFAETVGENTNVIFCSWSVRPYAMLLNDFSFQLFFKQKQTKKINESFFGINEILAKNKIINRSENNLKVAIFSDNQRQLINRKIASYFSKKLLDKAMYHFKEGFEQIFCRQAPAGIVRYFKYRVAISNPDQVEKFTTEHFIEVASQVLQEYAESIGNSSVFN